MLFFLGTSICRGSHRAGAISQLMIILYCFGFFYTIVVLALARDVVRIADDPEVDWWLRMAAIPYVAFLFVWGCKLLRDLHRALEDDGVLSLDSKTDG